MPQPTHTPAWHAAQEAQERAWLDQWARAEKTPGCPWARPDWDVMGDFASFVQSQRATAGSPR